MDDTATVELIHDRGAYECEIPVGLAERLERASRKSGLTYAEIWKRGRIRYSDAVKPDARPDLYEDCDSAEAAPAIMIRETLDRIVDDILANVSNPHRIDEPLE